MSSSAPSSNRLLPALARAAIARHLGAESNSEPAIQPAWKQSGASFVTLTQRGELRGCIGSLQAYRPLLEDVRANAVAAALHDPRFPPVTAGELATISIEVSVLSSPTSLPPMDHATLITTLRPMIDGVIVSNDRGQRATFLPQVWEQLPDIEHFLQHLKQKAGIAIDSDDALLHYAVYQVESILES